MRSLKEALRPFPYIHPPPHELQATEDMIEYFNYVRSFKIQILGIFINLLGLNPWEFASEISVLNKFTGDCNANILWKIVWESL